MNLTVPINYSAGLLAFVLMTGLSTAPAHGAVTVYYGFDAGGVGGPHPNSDAARESFLDKLIPNTVGVDDLEAQAVGTFLGSSVSLDFAPTGVTGLLQSESTIAAEISDVPTTSGSTSGIKFVIFGTAENSSFFTLTLDTPRTAFGFYGSSFSDYQGLPGGPFPPIQLTLDGGLPIDVLNVDPSSVPGGSINFFGVTSDTPFTTIRLLNPIGTLNDGVALDDITIAQAVPEPSELIMLGTGLVVIFGLRAKRRV